MVKWCHTTNLGPIGSAVLTFIGYKLTDKHPDKKHINKQPRNRHTNRQQTPRQAKFMYRYSACLSVRFYPITSKRLNRSGSNFYGTSCDPKEGLWMIEFLKICLNQNSNFWKFWKSTKFLFPENLCLLLFTMYLKRKRSQLK